jgi:hypothetical protein
MAQRIVLSPEQVKKLRQLKAGVGVAKDGETPEKHSNLQIQAPALEEAEPYRALTHGSIDRRIRRPWGFER